MRKRTSRSQGRRRGATIYPAFHTSRLIFISGHCGLRCSPIADRLFRFERNSKWRERFRTSARCSLRAAWPCSQAEGSGICRLRQYFAFAVIEKPRHRENRIGSDGTGSVDRCPADCRRLSLHPNTNRTFDLDSEYRIANPGMTITSTPVILF